MLAPYELVTLNLESRISLAYTVLQHIMGRGGITKRKAPMDAVEIPSTPATDIVTISKKQKRDNYRASFQDSAGELPKKKFYRQRAHANPFSDHDLT